MTGLRHILAAAAAALALTTAACGGGSGKAPNPNAKESSPPGDIPDNQVFVAYSPPGFGFSVKVPEGWSRLSGAGAVTFTDKLNAIRMESAPARAAVGVAGARASEVPRLARTVRGFRLVRIDTVSRRAGRAVRISYLADAKPNPVTGKAGRDAVERYVFLHRGRDVILTLSGPRGADNVDPWRIVTGSLTFSR